MKYLLPLALLFPLQSNAFEIQTTYRIFGDEIQSLTAPEIEIEAPASLIIKTTQDHELLIESDQSLDACNDTLNTAMGDATASVQIVVHENATTMNGIIAIQCAIFFR